MVCQEFFQAISFISVSTVIKDWPTETVSPSLILISETFPSTEEGKLDNGFICFKFHHRLVLLKMITRDTMMETTSPPSIFSPKSGNLNSINPLATSFISGSVLITSDVSSGVSVSICEGEGASTSFGLVSSVSTVGN